MNLSFEMSDMLSVDRVITTFVCVLLLLFFFFFWRRSCHILSQVNCTDARNKNENNNNTNKDGDYNAAADDGNHNNNDDWQFSILLLRWPTHSTGNVGFVVIGADHLLFLLLSCLLLLLCVFFVLVCVCLPSLYLNHTLVQFHSRLSFSNYSTFAPNIHVFSSFQFSFDVVYYARASTYVWISCRMNITQGIIMTHRSCYRNVCTQIKIKHLTKPVSKQEQQTEKKEKHIYKCAGARRSFSREEKQIFFS